MATKAELIYTADWVNLEKKGREFSLSSDISERLENFPRVIDNTNSTSATDALSANMGKVLQDQINEFTGVGTFLSLWDCSTWLPETDPTTNPYKYKVWNYYIVSKVAEEWNPNYRPRWTQYNSWEASRVEETEDVKVNDWYIYDWAKWIRQPNGWTEIAIDWALSPSSKNAVENRVVTNALNNKQDTINDLETIRQWAAKWNTAIQPWDNISELENNVWYQTEWDVVAKLTDYYTKDEIDEKENWYVKFWDNSPDDIFITAYDANWNWFEFYPNSFYIENEGWDVEEYEFFWDYRIAKLNETMRWFPIPKRWDDISHIVSILKRNEPVYFYGKDGEIYKIWVVQSFGSGGIRSYMNNAGDYLDVWVNENWWECDGYNIANADLVYQQSYTWHYLPDSNIWKWTEFSQYRATSSSFTVTGEWLFRMWFEYKLKVKNTWQSTITVTLWNKLLNPRNIPTTIAKWKEVIFLFYSSHNTMATMELAQRIERPIGEDMSNYYNKSEVDSLLEEKANSSDLDDKADKSELPDMSNYYNKTETDTLLNDKADKSDTYTKAEVDSAIAGVSWWVSTWQFIKNASQNWEKHQIDFDKYWSYVFSWDWYVSINMLWNAEVWINWNKVLSVDGTSTRMSQWTIFTMSKWDEVWIVPSPSHEGASREWCSGFVVDFYNWQSIAPDWIDNCLCFTAVDAGSKVRVNEESSTALDQVYYYSTDWNIRYWEDTTTSYVTLANVWDKVYWRAASYVNTRVSSYNRYIQFAMTGRLSAKWSVNYMINWRWTNELPDDMYCLSRLFYNCTSLVSLPELPATTLKTCCYENMFYWCTWIKLSATKTWDYQIPFRVPSSWTWVTADGALNNMFYWTWWTFKGTPTINRTYYLSTT